MLHTGSVILAAKITWGLDSLRMIHSEEIVPRRCLQTAIIALDLAPFVKHRCEGGIMALRPNLIVILIDDLRFDEFGAGGHPYMQTPHIDRLAHEGALFTNAFHTTPLCSPNRASILTGQYASRHGIIDNVGRDIASHRLDNYHVALKALGYETAHIGKWHMGNDASPRPGYDHWVSFKGQGTITNPVFWERDDEMRGSERQLTGYVTDLLNERAVEFVGRKRRHPFALFFA